MKILPDPLVLLVPILASECLPPSLISRAGEEISDTYCSTFTAKARDARADALRKYNFECACPACAEDWPTLPALSHKLTGLPADLYCKGVAQEDAREGRKKG